MGVTRLLPLGPFYTIQIQMDVLFRTRLYVHSAPAKYIFHIATEKSFLLYFTHVLVCSTSKFCKHDLDICIKTITVVLVVCIVIRYVTKIEPKSDDRYDLPPIFLH